jgi:hypothetical protein
MTNFIVEIFLPQLQDERFFNLIPANRKMIDNLIDNGIISTYCVNGARTKAWIVFNCDSAAIVKSYLRKLPIIDMVTYEIEDLLFADGEVFRFPKLNLN